MRTIAIVAALAALSLPAFASKELAQKNACLACHAVDKKLVGPAYQEIAPLRSRHIEGDIILVAGVSENYDPATTAATMRAALA